MLGLGGRPPRLSWWLPPAPPGRCAYEVELDDGRSGAGRIRPTRPRARGRSTRSGSRRRSAWRVRVWTDVGAVRLVRARRRSRPACSRPTDWSARVDRARRGRAPAARRAPGLRAAPRPSTSTRPVGARPGCTPPPTGSTRPFLNGARVGDLELTPGFTSYRRNLHVQTYDVDRPPASPARTRWEVRAERRLVPRPARQRAATPTATATTVGRSSASSRSARRRWSHRRRAGRRAPAPIRARRPDGRPGRGPPRRTGRRGGRSRSVDHDLGRLTSSPAPPVRRIEELRPRSVTRASPTAARSSTSARTSTAGSASADLGPAGTELHAHPRRGARRRRRRHHGAPRAAFDGAARSARSTGSSSAGVRRRGVRAAAHDHGFQYVRVDGPRRAARRPTTSPASSCTPTSRRTGWFRCSDDRHQPRSTRSPTGASAATPATSRPTARTGSGPGWTGDWQIFLADRGVPLRRRRVLREVAARPRRRAARRTGSVPNFVARPQPATRRSPTATSAGSGCSARPAGATPRPRAVGAVPRLRRRRRPRRAVADDGRRGSTTPPSGRATGRHPTRVERSPEPAPARGASSGTAAGTAASGCEPASTSTRRSPLVRRRPGPRGHRLPAPLRADRSPGSAALARRRRRRRPLRPSSPPASLDAWRTEFLADDGTLDARHPGQPRPGPRLRAGPRRPAGADAPTGSSSSIREAGTHLGTGFLATPLPAAGPRRHRPPRRRLRAAPPGHRAVVADDGRPRRHAPCGRSWEGVDADGVAARLAQPLQQGRGHHLPAPVRRRHPADRRRARLPPLPDRAPTRRRPHVGRGALRLPERPHRGRPGASTVSVPVDVTVPPGTSAVLDLPDGTSVRSVPGATEHACSLR